MYKVLILLEVAIAEWRYDYDTKQKYADEYLILFREFDIPFPPYIGLQLSADEWLPPPIENVRYDIDLNKFICHVPTDNKIPDGLDRYIQNDEKSDDEIDAYLNKEIEDIKSVYRRLGWKLYKE